MLTASVFGILAQKTSAYTIADDTTTTSSLLIQQEKWLLFRLQL
jgi:hypothetical protein